MHATDVTDSAQSCSSRCRCAVQLFVRGAALTPKIDKSPPSRYVETKHRRLPMRLALSHSTPPSIVPFMLVMSSFICAISMLSTLSLAMSSCRHRVALFIWCGSAPFSGFSHCGRGNGPAPSHLTMHADRLAFIYTCRSFASELSSMDRRNSFHGPRPIDMLIP